VGVVRDSKHNLGQQRAGDELYVPYTQVPAERLGQAVLLVRAVRDPAELAAAVRRETQAIEKDLALLDVRTLSQELERSVFGFRAMARLLGTVGGLALALAAIGLHGTLAYVVRGRTREIGIRIALGARTRAMLWMVVRETLSVVLAGALLGIGLALLVGRALASFLFGVEAAQPAIAALVVLLLLAVTVLAAWLPARRAMKVDPITALRFE
jgi:putative ABC transport system permease protein